MISDRVITTKDFPLLPNLVTWIVTANNPRLSEELRRRSVRIALRPSRPDPANRTDFLHIVGS